MEKRMISFILISLLLPCVSISSFAKTKEKEPVEFIYMGDDYKAIVRTRYGLIAKNVSEEKIFSHAPKNSRQWQVIKKGIEKKWSGKVNIKGYKVKVKTVYDSLNEIRESH